MRTTDTEDHDMSHHTRKPVSSVPLLTGSRDNAIQPCCDAAIRYQAIPTIRTTEPPAYGYVLESTDCPCDSRWLPYDWRHGHAEFITQ
jgi:hypothetical protein